MFNSFKINEETEFKFELYKNSSVDGLIGEIPLEYIGDNFHKSLEEINTFDMKIPKFVQRNGKQELNRLYNKVLPKMQVVVTIKNNNHVTKERYTLLKTSSLTSKQSGSKEFTGYNFEYTLKDKRCYLQGVYQLKTDSTHISSGVMDMFVKDNPNWGIGEVDELSRMEKSEGMEIINTTPFTNFTSSKITKNGLIWDKNITTNVGEGKSVYLNIQYNNLTSYTASGKKLLENQNIYNAIEEPLPKNCKRVRAYHYSGVGNRYGIKYIFTLSDNSNIERITTFTNVINKTFKCDGITFNYETGNVISYNNIKYINLDTTDNWYDFLKEVENQFNSVFIFDSYERKINVIHRDNLGIKSPIQFSFDTSIIDINITDNNTYPNALKVTGKNNLSISEENIYGGDIIYDFTWYKNNIMSDELKNNWSRYEDYLSSQIKTWKQVKKEYMDSFQRQNAVSAELQSLEQQLRVRKSLLATYINSSDKNNQRKIQLEIDELMKKVTESTSKLATYTELVQTKLDDMTIISNETKKENAKDAKGVIFTENNLLELNDLITIEEYSDEYYSTAYGLYNNAKLILSDKSKPHYDFQLNMINLLKVIKNPLGWNNILKLGNWFEISDMPSEVLNDLGENVVRLVGYTLDVKNKKIDNYEFTNKTRRKDYTKVASNIGKTANTTVRTSNSFGNIYSDAQNTINQTKTLREGMLDLASVTATNRTSSNIIDVGGYGAFFFDSTNQDNGLFITNDMIVLTHDGFKTSDVAISAEGIFANLLVGKEILGEKLMITNENGNFEIRGDGLYLYEGSSAIESNCRIKLYIDKTDNNKPKLELIGKDGQVVISSDGLLQTDTQTMWNNVSPNYPMETYVDLDKGVSRVKQCLIKLKLDRYRGFTKSITASSATTTTGQSNTSTTGQSNTSTTGQSSSTTTGSTGSHRHMMFSLEGSVRYSLNSDGTFPVGTYKYANAPSNYSSVNIGLIPTGNGRLESLYTYGASGSHSHSYSHYHNIAHTHNISHYHYLNLNLSTSVQTGIKLYEKASGVSLIVNGTTVRSGINVNCAIDITNYIKLDTDNIIQVASSTNGYIGLVTKCKYFTRF